MIIQVILRHSLNIILITNGHNYFLQAEKFLVTVIKVGVIAVVGGIILAMFSE
jgi:hypothetical protein